LVFRIPFVVVNKTNSILHHNTLIRPAAHPGTQTNAHCVDRARAPLALGIIPYGRIEAMDWAEDNDTDYIFDLAGNAVLAAKGKCAFALAGVDC
jgi:hypothetical protein